ncbi:MarR family winged helix-turn-helix transcriptional regulator [Nocardia goodfellowii]|uniref:DNA-binding MarR family transcriptional regulator n=1 Tax=Nocardia goodfellowii TaxID=882446 RepID=A0ABS4QNA2_9NOCA|nr:MarR family transcriptional regulator [Nocardia goodfellowii]MBP2193182.1 DNA-binding MarR family transcriptional regulator [Nocardia goodfellowii]
MDVNATRNRRPDATTPDGGPALFRLVRFWSRRWTGRAFTREREPAGDLRQIQHIQVVEAVAAALRTTTEATVTTVATQLGLDHSGASRMVRDAVAAGYLARGDSAHDRRRAVLCLTDSGRELHAAARDWQRRCFDQLTASWSDHDRRQFAVYLQRLADETTA